MSIKAIQNDFIKALFGGDKTPAASHVIGDHKLTAEQRFGIYSGSVHGILTQALGVTFPVCKSLVGESFFDNMCNIFIDQYPPTSSYFAEYGDKFPGFLSTFEHVKDIHYLPDVAYLEWARQEVWHQEIQQKNDFSKLVEVTEEEQAKLTFSLSKTLRLIESKYRIDDIWFAHQEDSNIKLEDIELDRAVKLFIWKDKDTIKISLMNHDEEDSAFWDFLHSITNGSTLEMLAEKFGERLPDFLNQGIQGGWITSFKPESVTSLRHST